jgi:hypothetical protein
MDRTFFEISLGLRAFKRPPEIPPVLPFQREESFLQFPGKISFFPLWKRGMKGDLTDFQKPKRLPNIKQKRPRRGVSRFAPF